MKIYQFDAQVGISIDKFGSSNFILSRIVRTTGQGWVRGEETNRLKIKADEAALREKGKWHKAGSDAGMAAIAIECDNFDSIFMPEG